VRPPAGPPPSTAEAEASAIRTLPGPGPVEPATAKPRPVVRPVPAAASAKPHVVSPTSFNHAQEVADKFKISQPVILNLQGVGRDLARRLIDFSSGLCYGLGGHMEKVAHQVYLLTPTNVEVSAEERRRLQERGLHDA
jgi:cell division inhibitor SepF